MSTNDAFDDSQFWRFEQLQEYCQLATRPELSPADAKRISNIFRLAACDRLLTSWLDRADRLIDDRLDLGELPDGDTIVSCLVLQDLTGRLTRVPPGKLTLERFQKLVERVQLSDRFLDRYVCFDDAHFSRKLICRTRVCTIYAIGWKPGQISDVHHHGTALDAIRVCRGQLTHWFYDRPGSPTPLEERFGENALVVVDRHQRHRMGNTSTEDLVTLHVRFGSPPDDLNWVKDSDLHDSVKVPCDPNSPKEDICYLMPAIRPPN